MRGVGARVEVWGAFAGGGGLGGAAPLPAGVARGAGQAPIVVNCAIIGGVVHCCHTVAAAVVCIAAVCGGHRCRWGGPVATLRNPPVLKGAVRAGP